MATHGPLFALFLAFSLIVSPLASLGSSDSARTQVAGMPSAQASHVLKVSQSPDRSNPVDLEGRTTSGNIYVFLAPESGAKKVSFYLDNPSATGSPFLTENNAPWDFAGGNRTTANPYDTRQLPNGAHSITAVVTLSGGGTALVTATFTVSNGAPVAPTPTAPPTAPPTATPAPATYANLVSKSADRSAPTSLQGQTVSGKIYVFVSPETGVQQVRFYLDDTSGSGTPLQTENLAPWDLVGGAATAANPYDTTSLSNGTHSITSSITLTSGAVVVITSTFSVNNAAPATATSAPPTSAPPTATATRPLPTATPQPTSTPTQAPYSLLVSTEPDRDPSSALSGKTLSGSAYIFVPATTGISQVRFYLDSSTTVYQTENSAPYDLKGGDAALANPLDTRTLANGAHYVMISVTRTDGTIVTQRSDFTVQNSAAPTATAPLPTPTPASTAVPPPASGSIYWGISMQGIPWDSAKLQTWETNVAGKPVSIIHWGHKWGDSSGNYRAWSSGALDTTRQHGSIPMISWTPEGGDPSKWQLRDIINGAHDTYIRDFARGAKAWGHPFFLRIMHEMNGDFGFPWQEMENGNARGEFVPAWKRIVDIFRAEGVTNASYVWCPNVDFYPNSPRPSYASLYPGDSYVDWTCLDGYNWGGVDGQWTGWESWDQVFEYSYGKLLEVAPSKPIMIGEFGSESRGAPPGTSKAQWFTNALQVEIPGQYNRIRAIVYFNWQMDGANWLIEENADTQAAWRNGIASSYYLPNQFGSISGKVPVP